MTKGTGRRDTVALIMDELERARKPLTAYDLLGRLRPAGVMAPQTIYRALAKLLTAHRIHRLETMNAFVRCFEDRAGGATHSHDAHGLFSVGFAICDACGSVQEFVDPLLKLRIEADAAARAFRALTSSVEVHGICSACERLQA